MSSMESYTTVLHGVTRPNSEPEPEPEESLLEQARKIFNCDCSEEDYFNQSPYDATLPPGFGGGNPIMPILITDEYRPILKNLSQLALDYYNNNINKEGSGECLEFAGLVKCAFWHDYCLNSFVDYVVEKPAEYYITFKAKAKGDPAITVVVQAKVLVDEVDKDKLPVVEECRIKKI